MARIGRPAPDKPNPYKNVQMAQISKLNSKNSISLKDQLNDASGVGRQEEFVDAKKHNQMDKDSFMKLLTFQLANQDPLKPVDQKKFSAELAQFAQLEQTAKMNKNIEKLASSHPTQHKFMSASFLGKEIQSKGSSLNYDGRSARTNIPFSLDRDAETVFVRIKDKSNNMVGQFEVKKVNRGTNSLNWDGISTDGKPAPPGEYHFDVLAFDKDMQQFRGKTRARGIVTDVHFEGKDTVLTVDGTRKVFLRDVISFGMPEKSRGQSASALPQGAASKAYAQQE